MNVPTISEIIEIAIIPKDYHHYLASLSPFDQLLMSFLSMRLYLLTCEGGTLEVPQPLCGVTASVCQEVGPVAGVEVGVIGQAQHHRHIGVLRLTRHLGSQLGSQVRRKGVAYLSRCTVITLDVRGLTSLTLGKQAKLVITPCNGRSNGQKLIHFRGVIRNHEN